MAHNTRIREAGLWTDDSAVTPAEFEAIDATLAKAINGDDGGTWAPAAAIIIGGAGLQVSGAGLTTNTVNGSWTCDGTPTAVGWIAGGPLVENSFLLDSPTLQTVYLPANMDWSPQDAERWRQESHGAAQQVDITQAWSMQVAIHPPKGSTLKSIVAYLRGATTQINLPGVMPSLLLGARNITTGAISTIVPQVYDTTGTAEAYRAVHTINGSCNHAVAAGNCYFAEVRGETNPDAVAGMHVYGFVYTFEIGHIPIGSCS